MSENAPQKRYKVTGEYIYCRVPNSMAGWAGRGKWQASGFLRNAILPPDVHPDDIAHLLTQVQPGIHAGQPLITEITSPEASQ